MNTLSNIKNTHIKTLVSGFIAIFLAASIVVYPTEAFQASLLGLKIWWDVIFPALLPFFIISEILLGFGVVHFMGILLEPLMKPLFNVPGAGAFVLTMGFASGYPMGAKLTTRLREQNMITKVEGERLVSFTTTSDPLFILGVIAVGFFHSAELGVFIALVHYSSSILVGLIMKYYKKNDSAYSKPNIKKSPTKNIIIKAFKAMHQARINDGRKFGKLMGDAVYSSIETLLMIGGFIMIFSVILSILTKIQFTLVLSKFIALILIPLGIAIELSDSIIYGLFEVTLGAKNVSEVATNIPMIQKLAILSAISAWGGISVHAQIAAILQKTDIKYIPFLLSRILHVIFAFLITLIIWKPLNLDQTIIDLPTFIYQIPQDILSFSLWKTFIYIGTFILWIIALLLILTFLFYFIKLKLIKKPH